MGTDQGACQLIEFRHTAHVTDENEEHAEGQRQSPVHIFEQGFGGGAIARRRDGQGIVEVGELPYNQAKNDAIGFRNHNPGNLRSASNSTGTNGGFATFANDDDGLSAMARQLMLYGDRGNNTLESVIHTYAPRSENDTRAYIDSVSGSTGYAAQERVNLHDTETLKSVMAAMIKHENGAQPYSDEELGNAIQTAISDDRWSGRRNPDALAQQRYDILSGLQSANRETSILSAPQGKSDENAVSENLARSIKEAMSDQSLKLEITMVNEKGDRKTYNVENNGRITTPMNY